MSDARDELSELLDDARAELDARVDPAAKDRLSRRIEGALGGAPPGAAAPPTPATPPPRPSLPGGASLATHAALASLAGALGYFVHAWTHPVTTRVETRERVVQVPVERVVEVVRTVPGATADASMSPPSTPRAAVDTLGAEQWLIDQASAALREGRASAAIASTEEHRRRFPRGQLRTVREVLRAESLAAAGRTDEARTAARAALRLTGGGPLRARLLNVLGEGDVR